MVYHNEDGSITSNAAPRTLIGDNAIIAAKDDEIARLIAERDEARAQVAELQDKLRFYGHFTRHPEAALAARDAAMRNEGRRQAAGLATGRKGNGWEDCPAVHPYDKGYIAACNAVSAATLATLEPEGGE